MEKKKHILMIPNWKEDEQTAFMMMRILHQIILILIIQLIILHPMPHLIGCLWPIWKKICNGYHSITIALPKEYSLLEKVFYDYGFEE